MLFKNFKRNHRLIVYLCVKMSVEKNMFKIYTVTYTPKYLTGVNLRLEERKRCALPF